MGKKNNIMEIENILEKEWKSHKKSCNFSNAYHESCRRSSDNSIYVVISSDLGMGGFRFKFTVPNRNVRQVSNHLIDSIFSV